MLGAKRWQIFFVRESQAARLAEALESAAHCSLAKRRQERGGNEDLRLEIERSVLTSPPG
jgi:hypothetical protein